MVSSITQVSAITLMVSTADLTNVGQRGSNNGCFISGMRAGSRLRWAGHIRRVSVERLTTRAWETEEGDRRGRERTILQWRDLERAEVNSRECPKVAMDGDNGQG